MTQSQLATLVAHATQARYQAIMAEGCRLVPDWYGNAQLGEILGRFGAALGVQGRFFIVAAPHDSSTFSGWNAESLADGTLLFNFDLLNASWTVAAGYARQRADASFDLQGHLNTVGDCVMNHDRRLPDADPRRALGQETGWIFRDMMAFVAGHELGHFVRHHLAQRLALAWNQGQDVVSSAILSQAHEYEADQFALDMMVRTWSYDPRGALLSLLFSSVLSDRAGVAPQLLGSHPHSRQRLARARAWLQASGLVDRI